MGLPTRVTDTGERVRHDGEQGLPCTVCFVVMDPTAPGGVRIATARAPAETLLRSAIEALRDELWTGAPTSFDVDAPGEAVAQGASARGSKVPLLSRIARPASVMLLLLAAVFALLAGAGTSFPWFAFTVIAVVAAAAFVLRGPALPLVESSGARG